MAATTTMGTAHQVEVTERQVRRSLRHGWLVVLLAGAALFAIADRTMMATRNPNFVPSVILLGAAVVPVTFVAFVLGRRIPFDVPVAGLMAVAFVGGVVGSAVAGFLEFSTVRRLGFLPMLGVGVIEEAAKLVVPIAVLLLLPYRRRVDGLLIGVAVGAGFAALETMGYGFVTLVNSQGRVSDLENVLLVRGITSPACHMAWTGICAAALWAAANARWSVRAVSRLVLTLVVAIALHTAWDSAQRLAGYVAVGVASLVLLAIVTHKQEHLPRHRRAALDLTGA